MYTMRWYIEQNILAWIMNSMTRPRTGLGIRFASKHQIPGLVDYWWTLLVRDRNFQALHHGLIDVLMDALYIEVLTMVNPAGILISVK